MRLRIAVLALLPAVPGFAADVLRVNGFVGFSSDHGIRSCAVSPDGKKLLSGENHFRLALYDIGGILSKGYTTAWAFMDYNGESPSDLFVAFSPDGHTVASATNQGRRNSASAEYQIRDAAKGGLYTSGTKQGAIRAVRFSPDGNLLALAGDDRIVSLLDWRKLTVRARLIGHTGAVYAIAWSPDGKTIASAGADLTIKLWRADTGAELRTFAGVKTAINTLDWSPDGASLASGGAGRELKIWNVQNGEARDFRLPPFGPIYGIAWSPDGRLIATAGKYPEATDGKMGVMVLWDTRTGLPASTTGKGGGVSANVAMTGAFFDVCFSRDGRTVVGVGQEANNKGRVDVWSLGGWEKSTAPGATADASPFADYLPARQHYDAGLAHFAQKRLADAEREFREVARLSPHYVSLHTALGAVAYNQGKYAEAEREYRLQTQEDPVDARIHAYLADALTAQEKFADAELALRDAVRLEPNNASSHESLGEALVEQQRYPEANPEFRAALRLDPKATMSWYGLGWIALASAKGDEALTAARAFLALKGWRDPYSIAAVLTGYLGARETRHDVEAKALMDEAATKCDAAAWPYLFIRYFTRAISAQQLLAAATDGPKSTEIHAYYGMDLELAGKKEEALTEFRWVIDNGAKHYWEHRLAVAEYARLGGR